MGVNCEYCGRRWELFTPLKYHSETDLPNMWHCRSDACTTACLRCAKSSDASRATMTTNVCLTSCDYDMVVELTKSRQSKNRKARVKDQKQYGRDGVSIAEEGTFGELAFSRLTGLTFDDTDEPRSGGHDTTMKDGRTVDVKTTDTAKGNLAVRMGKEKHPSDVYVLMSGRFPEYNIEGWCTKEELFVDDNKTDVGNGPFWRFPNIRLHSINDLLGYGVDNRTRSSV